MIAVRDLAYVRYQAPDLEMMEKFLLEFGMRRALRTEQTLYMRGCGQAHHIHVTELAPVAGTPGIGLQAGSADDLHKLAAERGVRVEANPAPDGGQRVRLKDPVGYDVDVLFGQRTVEPLSYREPIPPNPASGRRRLGPKVRLQPAPSTVVRLGHLVMLTPDFKSSFEFYAQVLGMQVSDSYYAGSPDNMVAAFLHCSLGDTWTDHHTVALVTAQDGKTRFDHTAFEVIDLDDVMQGGEHLKSRQYQRSWGVGRHVQGSQIFDYWRDPFGNKIEHWTDGDQVNDRTPVGHAELTPNELSQWAPELTPEYFT